MLIMEIKIVWGKSEGKTKISAFDKALLKAGIHNFNLVSLSSVIPQDATVSEVETYESSRKIGDILYVVISSFSSSKPNAQISAGLGWVQTKEGGLFIESRGEYGQKECEEEISKGLNEMLLARGWKGEIKMRVVTHKVKEIANVTVAAVYNFGSSQ